MPRGLDRTDLNTTGTSFRNGIPVVTPINFGQAVTLPKNFGNVMPFDAGNPVTWAPSPVHFGNDIGQINEFVATVTLTAAQVKSLNTPILVVPGIAGYIPLIESGYMVFTPGNTPYNVGPNDSIVLYVGNGTLTGSLLNYTGTSAADFIDAFDPDATIAFFDPSYMFGTAGSPIAVSVPTSDVSGNGMYLIQYDSSMNFPSGANWTAGNGTLKIVVEYSYVGA